MSEFLIDRDFDVILCYSENATTANILKAWRQLIWQTKKDDVVVVYYLGHGGTSISTVINELWRT